MVIHDEEVRLIPASHEGLERPALDDPHEVSTEVCSKVESQFRQMERAHQSIRTKHLAARLAPHTIN